MRITCLILLVFTSISVYSQSLDVLKARKAKTQKEIEYTTFLLNKTGENTKASLNKLSLLNQQIDLRNNLIEDCNSQLNILQKNISDNQFVILQLTEDLDRIKSNYASMIQQAYRNRGDYNHLFFILSSESFNQAYKRLFYIRQMARYRQKQSQQIEAIRLVLQQKTEDLSQKKTEQQEILTQQMAESSKLNVEKKKQSSYYQELKKKEKDLKKHLEYQQRIDDKLTKEIERIIEEEARKSKTKAPTPEEKTFSDNFEKNKGNFPWPVATGVITDRFGEHSHAVMKNIIVNNNGIDITTDPGEKARSIFNGTVSRVFAIPGGNMAVIIRHGEYISVYSNLKEVYVKQGDKVETKQNIGLIYSDPSEDNKTILKFQIRKESLKLNPEEWISR